MALVSRIQMHLGHETIVAHPDFAKPWCKTILADPDIEWVAHRHEGTSDKEVSNSMFEWTLYSERGLRAHLAFRRPCNEPDAIKQESASRPMEQCFLISIGDALDGKTGRAHGGLSSVILDHISGHSAHYADPRPISPATATMTVDYHRPVSTPCVVFVRAWLIEYVNRKVWIKAVMLDEEGRPLASAKSLFILAKPPEKL